MPLQAGRLRAGAATVLLLWTATTARAQCPDGTPPPCGNASAAAGRNLPPLREDTWIVVPFTNVARTGDLEWLRDASVNLLSLDLRRWTDISVVDDKRVADLLRRRPAARATQALSLEDGIAIARQAGAGRLVMGDFVKLGRATRLVANVFDVRREARLRSIQQSIAEPESLLTAFGPLARGVLAVAPPAGATVGATGTTNADAYREYLLGLTALHRFDLTKSRQHLLAAIARDSTFALAHYKLSILMHWMEGTSAAERAHAVTAARLGGSLPPREQALISSRLASAAGDHERACGTLATLVKRDSSDVEALYGLGDCRYHAGYMRPEPTADSTRGRFRGDWNGAIAMFRRALVIDPSYHPAFEHVLTMLTTEQIAVCITQRPGCSNNPVSTYAAFVIRDADTLLIQPVLGDYRVKLPHAARQDSTRSMLLNLREARRIAREWTDAGPAEARAHLNLAFIDMRLGELKEARGELAVIPSTADPLARVNALEARVQIATQLGDGDAGRAALDTLSRELAPDSTSAIRLGALAAAFGRVQPLVRAIEEYGVAHRWSAERRAHARHRPYAMLGVPLPSMAGDEQRYAETLPNDTTCMAGRDGCRSTYLMHTLAFAPRVERSWRPYYSARPAGTRFFGSYAIGRGDTSYIRVVARFADSVGITRRRSGLDDLAFPLHAGEMYLALGDIASALTATRTFTDTTLTVLARTSTSNDNLDWPYLLVPRMMRQRGDLAAQLGYRDEARTWYERFLKLWSDPDPELRPEVDRVRLALAKLGRAP